MIIAHCLVCACPALIEHSCSMNQGGRGCRHTHTHTLDERRLAFTCCQTQSGGLESNRDGQCLLPRVTGREWHIKAQVGEHGEGHWHKSTMCGEVCALMGEDGHPFGQETQNVQPQNVLIYYIINSKLCNNYLYLNNHLHLHTLINKPKTAY